MSLYRLYTRLPRGLILLIFLLLIIVYAVFNFITERSIYYDFLRDENFLGTATCPACYGQNLCPSFHNGSINFGPELANDYAVFNYMMRFANRKNVYHGRFDDKKVIIKRLAHNSELSAIDRRICEMASMRKNCNVSAAMLGIPKYSVEGHIMPDVVVNLTDFTRCPSLRLLDLTMENWIEKKERLLSHEERLNLIMMLMVNPEPVIMQTFPTTKSAIWPFPRYYGACGRLIVTEDVGKTLSSYHNAPWEERIDYAYQLMKIAEQLSDNDIGFAMYWTDVSYDNLAVNKHGKVIIIDVENIIVVDKAKIRREKRQDWNKPAYTVQRKCPVEDCLTFDTHELCTRYTADLNFFALCKNLFSGRSEMWSLHGGLLHDLPREIEETWHISQLVQDCIAPNKADQRFAIIKELTTALEKIRIDFF